MPDVLLDRDGAPRRLPEALAAPRFHLLLCGSAGTWRPSQLARLRRRFDGVVDILLLSDASWHEPGVRALHDPHGQALAELGASPTAQYLVRPDGHVAYRSAASDLDEVTRHLTRWLPASVV